jgi:hypothetical protein
MATLTRIHESCKTQSLLESADVFTPTKHVLQEIRRAWMVNRIHDLPTVAAPSFFPSASRNDDIWWGSQDMKTVYLWDSMDDQDRQNTMAARNQIAGVLRSRDGGGEETSEPQRLRNRSNVG